MLKPPKMSQRNKLENEGNGFDDVGYFTVLKACCANCLYRAGHLSGGFEKTLQVM